MPWNPRNTMNLRLEFVNLALQEGANRRELCRRFGISAKTGYKWLARHAQGDSATALGDRSRRPLQSPARTTPSVEQQVVELRQAHPAWGGRKISRRLRDQGHMDVPAPSTVTGILHRHGLIEDAASAAATPWQRFEHAQPNELWQMDFKGWFALQDGRRCSPLTVLDDHSRYNLALDACGCTDSRTVQQHLERTFRRYGLPLRINADNGSPWGSPSQPGQLSELAIWLIRLGVRLSHSRVAHPQTNGKEERFHRTLKAEVINGRHFSDLPDAQQAFDTWRMVYNHQRPHQALGMATPVTRYRPSVRTYPETLPPIEYGENDVVQRVRWNGELRFRTRRFKVSNALQNLPVAIRERAGQENCYDLFFAHHHLGTINLDCPK
ncbi:transposase InsO family protein [Paraburkholderia atlantica]|uniref:IS481 family transposase n=3 Tax=Paraburkholderia atlantica TaxID=2654982 RepID=UPI003D225FDA